MLTSIFKIVTPNIINVITYLINLLGIFSEKFKISVVKPIHKSGEKMY